MRRLGAYSRVIPTAGVACVGPTSPATSRAPRTKDPWGQWHLDGLRVQGVGNCGAASTGGGAVIDTSREANYLEVSDNLGVTNNVVESNAGVTDAAGHGTIGCGFVPVASESA